MGQPNIPKPIQDGVYVTGGDNTRSHVATWTILVTLGAPGEEPDLDEKIAHFRKVINDLHDIRSPVNATQRLWQQRLDEIADI